MDKASLVVAVAGMSVKAIDRRNGKVAWRYELAQINERHNVSRLWIENDRVIVVSYGKSSSIWDPDPTIISCLDYQSGALRWEQRIEGGYATLLVDQDQVLVATTTNAFAFSLGDGAQLWTQILESTGPATALAIPGVAVQGDYSATPLR